MDTGIYRENELELEISTQKSSLILWPKMFFRPYRHFDNKRNRKKKLFQKSGRDSMALPYNQWFLGFSLWFSEVRPDTRHALQRQSQRKDSCLTDSKHHRALVTGAVTYSFLSRGIRCLRSWLLEENIEKKVVYFPAILIIGCFESPVLMCLECKKRR